MTIWVDADACPVPIKQMLFRAADRVGVDVVLVANHAIAVPRSKRVRFMQVAPGFDVADNAIVEAAEPGDLVISADIELAAEALAKGAAVIGPRGEVFSNESIRGRQVQREFMQTLRESGIATGGPAPLHARDKQAFASALERWLNQYQRAQRENKA
ncbi:YaiI/YqxD family protein [Guyparkeria sp. SCN-R1]|uniref:YaiI/YqxD family protein n=1 Tax=Guyparkeria sp. SCN-R1 TaxID=2341113 RepID=UPI000F648F05|nr:YaiI/YqxD family protein [Guyparkeria sp. SCN-R1]RRQ24718.1 YaiI/YqxD family protein [Guyparkeria sp. SCN-R1]